MKIGIISDTHGILDEKPVNFFSECDEIWHAGDIGNKSILEKLGSICTLRAVSGNIDSKIEHWTSPEHHLFVLEGMQVLIIHIAGNPPGYNREVYRFITRHNPDMLVCGHSHILKVMFDKVNHLLFINPGAAGNQGFHTVKTAIRMKIKSGKPSEMEVLEWERHKKRP